MTVLIDGNNLLFAAARLHERPPGRTQLCATLGVWARRYRRQVHVVFDGASPPEPRASQIGDPSVQVEFSGPGVTADAVVIRAIHDHSAPRRLLVVSSDRAIAQAARRRRATPVRSELFWAQVLEDIARPPRIHREPGEKRGGLGEGQGEQWLREFGFPEPPRE